MLIETIPTACADRAMKNAHTERQAIGATQIVGLRLASLGLTRPTLFIPLRRRVRNLSGGWGVIRVACQKELFSVLSAIHLNTNMAPDERGSR